MLYALWDTDTINLVASFDNRRDALALVLNGIERNGPGDTDSLALEIEDEDGNITPVAYGRELAELARREIQAASRLVG
ncbi:MAG: hypothetical protein M9953_13630 [Thermomicrobiales bacterium]|nr:hypothetical protein [Thermomicrobiales bacterium]MCO5219893.1 hypothetical protein [Thermomicrobiales bacterium]MCO5226374.1 hypothetical protein [Thermomicrobiales bacterium]MCO5228933.1 hypothetical protein [Thermomicrobiales bacterium]